MQPLLVFQVHTQTLLINNNKMSLTVVVIDMVHDFINLEGVFAQVFGEEDTQPIRNSAKVVSAMINELSGCEIVLVSSKYQNTQFKNVPGICSTSLGQKIELSTIDVKEHRILYKNGNSIFDQTTEDDIQKLRNFFYNKTVVIAGATIPACVQSTIKDLRSCCAHIIVPVDCVSARVSSQSSCQKILSSWNDQPDITMLETYKLITNLPSPSSHVVTNKADVLTFATSMFLIENNHSFQYSDRVGDCCQTVSGEDELDESKKKTKKNKDDDILEHVVLTHNSLDYCGDSLLKLILKSESENVKLIRHLFELISVFRVKDDDVVVTKVHDLIKTLLVLDDIVESNLPLSPSDMLLVASLSFVVYKGFPLSNIFCLRKLNLYWIVQQTNLSVKKSTPPEWKTGPMSVWKRLVRVINSNQKTDEIIFIKRHLCETNTNWTREMYDEIGLYSNPKPLTDLGIGDCMLYGRCMKEPYDQSDFFSKLNSDVCWQTMEHRGGEVPRLVSVQGDVDDGLRTEPCYRHPADAQPKQSSWSPLVFRIKQEVEKVTKSTLNHVLIQKYRTGEDNISPHADKTLDIKKGSEIINVSFGASRTMTLSSKKDVPSNHRSKQLIELPDNSIFVLGWESNRRLVHGIRPDKRSLQSKNRPSHQTIESGARISLTFRTISSFLYKPTRQIFGQGSPYLTISDLPKPSEDHLRNREEELKMLKAFGSENNNSNFDWSLNYGEGFTVMNLKDV